MSIDQLTAIKLDRAQHQIDKARSEGKTETRISYDSHIVASRVKRELESRGYRSEFTYDNWCQCSLIITWRSNQWQC